MKTTVYLVRHAEAMGNVLEIFQGHTDAEVSENGLRQLELLKERFKDINYDLIYSSPLKRAYQTAEAANFYHDNEIKVKKALIEINGGLFEGNKFKDLPILFPESFELWQNKHHEFKIENGESMIEVYNRISNAITEIITENAGKTIVIVSHGCAIRNFICYASGYGVEKISEIPWCDNTAITKMIFDDKLNAEFEYLNDAKHLGDEFSTLSKQSWWKK